MPFFSELKRRNVFRVALAYLVLSWLVLQVADVLVEALELPTVWSKGIIAALVVGFIPALVFSWIYELTPEGLRREADVDHAESIAPQTGQKLNIAVVVMLGIAIVLFAADRFMGPRDTPAAAEPQIQAATEPVQAPVTRPDIPVVAVLPLQALSTEEEGEFLASGLHDDLLTRLARLDAFRVISRTSVMEYAHTNKNLRQIAQELGAGYIVEGGLQAIGGRVRINAQLIDASTDEHLWANTYERALTPSNLFDVQAEIATAIAEATHSTLSPKDVAVLDTVPTENMEAYQAYLKGLDLFGELSKPSMHRSLELFRQATVEDPGFVDAWAMLASAHLRLYWEEGGEAGLEPDPTQVEAAEHALDRARELDPDNVSTLIAQAYYYYYGSRDYSSALIELGRAEALAPNNTAVIALRGFLLRRLGRMDEAADALLAAYRAEPAWVSFSRETMATLVFADRCDEALDLQREALVRFPENNGILDLSAFTELVCSRDMAAVRRLAARIEPTNLTELDAKFTYLMFSDRNAAALMLENIDEDLLRDPVTRLVMNDYRVWLYRAMGQTAEAERALAQGDQAAEAIKGISFGILAEKAFHAALKGDHDAARDFGEAALAAAPNDAMVSNLLRYGVARAWTTAGLTDKAMELLQTYRTHIGRSEFALIDIDPFLAPLKDHPGFETLLAPESKS